jgi:hypothetical protein
VTRWFTLKDRARAIAAFYAASLGFKFLFVAGALEFIGVASDVGAKFFVEVGIELRAMEEGREKLAEIREH